MGSPATSMRGRAEQAQASFRRAPLIRNVFRMLASAQFRRMSQPDVPPLAMIALIVAGWFAVVSVVIATVQPEHASLWLRAMER
jgi:hypothetical protein